MPVTTFKTSRKTNMLHAVACNAPVQRRGSGKAECCIALPPFRGGRMQRPCNGPLQHSTGRGRMRPVLRGNGSVGQP